MSTDTSDIPPAITGKWGPTAAQKYEEDPLAFLSAAAGRCGDAFRFGLNSVYLGDPESVHAVLAGTGRAFHAGQDPLQGFRRTTDADTSMWMRGRRVAGQRLGLPPQGTARLVRRLGTELAARAGTEVDVPSAAPGLCSRSALAYCLSRVPPRLADPLAEAVADAATTLARVQDAALPWPAWVPLSPARRARSAGRKLAAVLDTLIAERLRGAGPAHRDEDGSEAGNDRAEDDSDLLDGLLANHPEGPTHVRATLHTLLAGTHLVPGAALTWLVAELTARPELAERLREEATSAAAPLDADPERFPLAVAVAKETLRLHPPVWLMARLVDAPVQVAGRSLVPGQQVVVSPYLVQRDPRWWTDPEEFRPERWLARAAAPVRHSYLPFGAGERVCAGYQLGQRQLAASAALLCRDYTLTPTRPPRLRPTFESVLMPQDLRVRWDPRPSAGAARRG